MAHVTARQVVRFQWIAPNIQTGFHRGDAIIHNQTDWHFAQPHPDHFAQTNRRICDPRPEPKAEKVEKNNREHEGEQRQNREADKIKGVHIAAKTIGRETPRKGLIADKGNRHCLGRVENRCEDASHFKSTACKIKGECFLFRELWECVRVLAPLFGALFAPSATSVLSSHEKPMHLSNKEVLE